MRRRSPGYVLISMLAAWSSISVAMWTLWPVYESPRFLIAAAAGLAGGTLIGVLAALLRWPSFVVLALTVLMFLLVGVPVAVPAKADGVLPTWEGLLDLVAASALSWRQLLTISLPVGDYQALLVPAFILALVGTVATLSIALRARRAELAALVPVSVFAVGIAFGPTVQMRPIELPLILLGIVLLWLVWLRWQRRALAVRALADAAGHATRVPPAGRSLLSAALILCIAAVSAVGASFVLPPSSERTVLRTVTEIPFDPRSLISPLSGFRSFLQEPTSDSVLLEVEGLPEGAMLRLATLDTYDGVVFSVGTAQATSESGSFRRVPSDVEQSGVQGRRVSVSVRVGSYTGVWVPTVGLLERIDFDGARANVLREAFTYNDVTGAAADTVRLEAGDGYTLQAVLPLQPGASDLADLAPGSAVVPTARLVPEELTARLEEYVRGVEGEGERLAAMLAGLARDGYISHGLGRDEPPSRSGHAADRLAELVTDPIMIGDAEQYASAAALMAGDLGFPARVVLGFVPDGPRVHGRDVTAWIEVDTAQFGWVAIDPNPALRDIPEKLPEERDAVSRPQTVVPPPVIENETFDRQVTPESTQEDEGGGDRVLAALLAVLRIVGSVLVALALVLSPFLAVIAAKLRRRRLRRSAGSVAQRINGGWMEFEDAVADHGLHPSPNGTRSEVAAVVGGQQAGVLAAVADHAMFSPDPLQDHEAESVWRVVDELTAMLDDDLGWWQRLRVRLSLRSLGGASVTGLLRTRR